jgi:hypothetical protein
VVLDGKHQKDLPGRHVHLGQEIARPQQQDRHQRTGREGQQDDEHVGDEVREDHRVDDAESRRKARGQEEREPGQKLGAKKTLPRLAMGRS